MTLDIDYPKPVEAMIDGERWLVYPAVYSDGLVWWVGGPKRFGRTAIRAVMMWFNGRSYRFTDVDV